MSSRHPQNNSCQTAEATSRAKTCGQVPPKNRSRRVEENIKTERLILANVCLRFNQARKLKA